MQITKQGTYSASQWVFVLILLCLEHGCILLLYYHATEVKYHGQTNERTQVTPCARDPPSTLLTSHHIYYILAGSYDYFTIL